MVVFVFVHLALLFNDSLNSSSESEVGFFISREAGHCSSPGSTGFQILLNFVLGKAISFSNWTCHFFFIKFPSYSFTSGFYVASYLFLDQSLEMWEGTRVYIKSHVPCSCQLKANMKRQNSPPKWLLLVNLGKVQREFVWQREMALVCFHTFRQVFLSAHYTEGMIQTWHHSTISCKMPDVFLGNTKQQLEIYKRKLVELVLECALGFETVQLFYFFFFNIDFP